MNIKEKRTDKIPFRKRILFNGETMTVYSLGWLAILTNRHPQTVREWERKGILPKPIYGDLIDKEVRYYTPDELVGYAQIFNSHPRPRGKNKTKTDWYALKVKAFTFAQKLKEHFEAGNKKLLELSSESAIVNSLQKKRKERTAVNQVTKILKKKDMI